MFYLFLSSNDEDEELVIYKRSSISRESFNSDNTKIEYEKKCVSNLNNSSSIESENNVLEDSTVISNIVRQEYFYDEEKINFLENVNVNDIVVEKKYIENDLIIRERKKQLLIIELEKSNLIKFQMLKSVLKIFMRPWEVLLNILTPRSYEGYYLFIHFLVPSILIWNISEIELFFLEKLMKRLNLSPNFLGLTITAWGNNAPDMFNVASAMSNGMVDLAINAAIASEIHNILLGLALPWLIYNIRMHKPVTFTSSNIYAFTLFFFCFFVLSFIIGLKLNNLRFDSRFAIFLIIIYLIFFAVILAIFFKIHL